MNKKRRRKKVRIWSGICILLLSAGLLGYLFLAEKKDNTEEKQEQAGQKQVLEAEEKQDAAESDRPETEKQQEAGAPSETEMEPTEEEKKEAEIAAWIADMSLEEKTAQLFMITPEALTGYGTVTAASTVTKEALKKYPVGGVILFGNNVVSPEQLSGMTENLMAYSMELTGLPLFIGIDEEGGKVTRIAENAAFDVPRFSNMSEIGASGDTALASNAGTEIGRYLNQYGINVDFAPVADVLTNPQNEVVRARSFGSDANVVAEMDLAFAESMEAQGVLTCMKHFPGHGGTSGDTHHGYSYTEKSLEELKAAELVPFQRGIDAGISFIMASHIAAPNVTGDETPASLSGKLIAETLRADMGYDGIVITDAMNMGAIVNGYDSKTSAVEAILAGADIVLMPKDFAGAYQGVLEAVRAGGITEERINESVKRILSVKINMKK